MPDRAPQRGYARTSGAPLSTGGAPLSCGGAELPVPGDTVAGITSRRLTAPPLLAVEVRSPSTALIDLPRKKTAYARFGAASHWIVVPDPRRPELTTFELKRGRYTRSGHAVGDGVLQVSRPFPAEVVPARLTAGLPPGPAAR